MAIGGSSRQRVVVGRKEVRSVLVEVLHHMEFPLPRGGTQSEVIRLPDVNAVCVQIANNVQMPVLGSGDKGCIVTRREVGTVPMQKYHQFDATIPRRGNQCRVIVGRDGRASLAEQVSRHFEMTAGCRSL